MSLSREIREQGMNMCSDCLAIMYIITVDREIFVLKIIRGLNLRIKIFCRLTVLQCSVCTHYIFSRV